MHSLSREDIKNFIRTITSKNITIKYDKKIKVFPAQISEEEDKYSIEFGEEFLNSNIYFQYAYALHEIGHIYAKDKRSLSRDELAAHIWAIEICYKFRWRRIYKALVEIIESWSNFSWNERKGTFRRYILASKLFKERINSKFYYQ